LPEKEIWDYALQILKAIQFLHQNNIIHRDIKCLNIFLTDQKVIKIGDLGVSKFQLMGQLVQGTRVGTPLYLAPELVKSQPYDHKIDIWAIGCALYHLAVMEPPF
jgi:NIMA (never in mitosis gene a)-related kinase